MSFRNAITIRNRATHPKLATDLVINDADLETIRLALSWLLSVSEEIMSRTAAAQASFVKDSRDLLNALKTGEKWALELYYRELSKPEPKP